MKAFYGNLKLGILGGGQLGRMWIQNALNYNVSCHVIDPDTHAPCRNICDEFTVGDISDFDTVYAFGKKLDLITIEIEKANVEALEKLESEGILVYPQPSIIKMIRDKGTQKQWMKDNNIPTSDFSVLKDKSELAQLNWAFPYVQKIRKDGYDGRGVHILRQKSDLAQAFEKDFLVERMVDFKKELSVIVARNAAGQISTFPLVEMEFHPQANLVEFLISPADVSAYTELQAANIACDIAEKLNLVGLLAVEMFLTADNKILVNEMAPRPHNSGHQSIEGNITSQFEQHLRAIFNQPLGDTSAKQVSVMVNVLGEEGYTGDALYEGLENILKIPGVYVHLYGKKTTKPFRKMGHVTITDQSRDIALQKARKVKETLKVLSV